MYNTIMNIHDLEAIGKTLFREVRAAIKAPGAKFSTGVGAAGDKTFPVDTLAEEIIISGLKALNEPMTIVSEEMGCLDLNGGGTRIVVDPIDGSKNAISGLPVFCTSIAVAKGDTLGDVDLAYVLNLANGDEFRAEAGAGTYLNNLRIHTQEGDILSCISYEAQVPGRDIPAVLPLLSHAYRTRCLGATALDLAYLASGAVSVFATSSFSRSFDFAGGWLLVKESGGIVTDISGRPVEDVALDLKKRSSLLAAGNAELHKKALGYLSDRGKGA